MTSKAIPIFRDWAAGALDAYDDIASRFTGDAHCGGLSRECQLSMLLASLHHLADDAGWDWAAATKRADETYALEVA